MMPPYVEYEYECICGSRQRVTHLALCETWNWRRKRELSNAWQETGIARYWREQAELAAEGAE